MRWLSRWIVILAVLWAMSRGVWSRADPESDGRAAVAIARTASPAAPTEYEAARDLATRTRRPLVVWVRLVDDEAERELSGYVHAHTKRLANVTEGIVVCVPDGAGDLNWTATLPASASVEAIRQAVRDGEAKTRAAARPQPQTHQHATPAVPLTFAVPMDFPAAGPPRSFAGAGFGGFRGGNCGPSG